MNLLKKNREIVILGAIMLLSIGLLLGYRYLFAAPLTTIEITAEYQGSAEYFYQLLQTDYEQWHNKIVQISGIITEINEEGILLNHNIYCQLDEKLTNMAEYDLITLKGRVIGYDELLEETKLNQCIIIQ
ncbi:MAG: hypothetical protein ACO3M5_00175 [Saprospiraceae bacterium]|jgi:hypothetical protein